MKNLFVELYIQDNECFNSSEDWDLTFDISNHENLASIEVFIVKIQVKFQLTSIEYYNVFEEAFLKDILKLKTSYSNTNTFEFINYLQLSILTNSIGYFNNRGLFAYAG